MSNKMKTDRKFLWASSLAALSLLASCSDNEMNLESQNAQNAVTFGVSAGKQSRATVVDNTSINQSGSAFGVFAYYTGQQTWTEFYNEKTAGGGTIGAPDFMKNQAVKYQTSGEWTYTPVKYWSNTTGDKVSFFSYWPYSTDKITVSTDNGLPQLTFQQDMDPTKMTDFIVSVKLDQEKTASKVTLPFKHALTRLKFSAKSDAAINDSKDTKIFVRGLRILGTESNTAIGFDDISASGANADSKVYTKGTFMMGAVTDATTGQRAFGGSWSTLTEQQTSAIDLNPIMQLDNQNFSEYTTNSVAVTCDGSTTSLTKDKEYVFLLPPNNEQGISSPKDVRVQVDYDVVTADNNLAEKHSAIATSATISLPDGSLKMGVAYNVILTIGLSEVKLSASVDDWDQDQDAYAYTYEISGTDNNAILEGLNKLNETKGINNDNDYFYLKMTTAPTIAELDLSSDSFEQFNFEDGDQIEIDYPGGGKLSVKPSTGWTVKYNNGGKIILQKTSVMGYYFNDFSSAIPEGVTVDEDGILNVTILNAEASQEGVKKIADKVKNAGASPAKKWTSRAVSASDVKHVSLNMPLCTTVKEEAFKDFAKLYRIYLPKVETIGKSAFSGCFAKCDETSCKHTMLIEWATSSELSSIGESVFGVDHEKNTITDMTGVSLCIGSDLGNNISPNKTQKTLTVNQTTYNFCAVTFESDESYVKTDGSSLQAGAQDFKDGDNNTKLTNKD